MTITIDVTAKLIHKGKRCSTYRCPIALAFEPVISPGWDVAVKNSGAILSSGTISYEYVYVELPEEAQRFIREFDDTGIGEPFSFPLSLPVSALKPERT